MAVPARTMATAAVAATAIFLTAIYALSRKDRLDAFAACRSSVISGGAGSVGGPFTLTDENGKTVTDRDVLSGPALVYFGYTYCPDVCPVDAARNAAAVDVLDERGYDVTPVFITVDPRRDTAAWLKEWTDLIHPRMIGLTGTDDQIRAVAQAYKTFYKVPDDPVGDDYLVDHMTHTYLMLPKEGFVEFFSRDVSADALADQVSCFIDAADQNG